MKTKIIEDRIDEINRLERGLAGIGPKYKGIPATTEEVIQEATEFYNNYLPKN